MKTHLLMFSLTALVTSVLTASAQATAFTYQGRMMNNGAPADGNYDVRFILYNADIGGSQFGPVRTNSPTPISDGLFTARLDFGGGIFDGAAYWLEIAVRTNGSAGAYTVLAPRQRLLPVPYAIHASSVTLTNGAVDTSQLAAGAVTAMKLASNSVTGAKIADFAVDTTQLANGAVTAVKLASNAVTSLKVVDATLLPADLDLDRFNRTFWKVGGNAGTSADFIGTMDDQPFDIRVNDMRVMRYRLGTYFSYTNSPNIVGGSPVNFALTSVAGATIAGGGGTFLSSVEHPNKVTANFGTVSGGRDNASTAELGTVSGGSGNTAVGYAAVVSGGYNNLASGGAAAVVGGSDNTASGYRATVSGGIDNNAAGDYSFAGGAHAKADHDGSFVWADSNVSDFHSVTADHFSVRCTGGARFVTLINSGGDATAGVSLLPGDNAWRTVSDRNAKKNFKGLDSIAVLEKLAAISIGHWHYKWESETNTPHLGPMAQDFKAAFYPGRGDTSISTMEFDGVELAAIQGLNRKLENALKARDARIAELENRLATLEQLFTTRANP